MSFVTSTATSRGLWSTGASLLRVRPRRRRSSPRSGRTSLLCRNSAWCAPCVQTVWPMLSGQEGSRGRTYTITSGVWGQFCCSGVRIVSNMQARSALNGHGDFFLTWPDSLSRHLASHSQISLICSAHHRLASFITLNDYKMKLNLGHCYQSLHPHTKGPVAHSVLVRCTEWAGVSAECDIRVIHYQIQLNQCQNAWMGCSLAYILMCSLSCSQVLGCQNFFIYSK